MRKSILTILSFTFSFSAVAEGLSAVELANILTSRAVQEKIGSQQISEVSVEARGDDSFDVLVQSTGSSLGYRAGGNEVVPTEVPCSYMIDVKLLAKTYWVKKGRALSVNSVDDVCAVASPKFN